MYASHQFAGLLGDKFIKHKRECWCEGRGEEEEEDEEREEAAVKQECERGSSYKLWQFLSSCVFSMWLGAVMLMYLLSERI